MSQSMANPSIEITEHWESFILDRSSDLPGSRNIDYHASSKWLLDSKKSMDLKEFSQTSLFTATYFKDPTIFNHQCYFEPNFWSVTPGWKACDAIVEIGRIKDQWW